MPIEQLTYLLFIKMANEKGQPRDAPHAVQDRCLGPGIRKR